MRMVKTDWLKSPKDMALAVSNGVFKFAECTLVLSAFRFVASASEGRLLSVIYWVLFVAFLAPFVVLWAQLLGEGGNRFGSRWLRIFEMGLGAVILALALHAIVQGIVQELLRLYP